MSGKSFLTIFYVVLRFLKEFSVADEAGGAGGVVFREMGGDWSWAWTWA
jgi:hypothetical protein